MYTLSYRQQNTATAGFQSVQVTVVIFTSAKEDNYVFVAVGLPVCLSVCLIATLRKKLPNGFSRNFQGRLAIGPGTAD